jgi:Amt family ammonium transporter
MAWNGAADGLAYGDAGQLGSQLLAVAAAPAYAFAATFIILKLVGALMPSRATEDEEAVGMDITQHGEEAYVSGEGALLIRVGSDGEPAEPPPDREPVAGA